MKKYEPEHIPGPRILICGMSRSARQGGPTTPRLSTQVLVDELTWGHATTDPAYTRECARRFAGWLFTTASGNYFDELVDALNAFYLDGSTTTGDHE